VPDDPSSADYFDPAVKCCSYVPSLPNFLAGRILSDDSPEAAFGLQTVRERIAAKVGISPLGMSPSPVYSALYQLAEDGFGKNRNMRCPHYVADGGRCGIWRNRESTCWTWFCKHVRGRVARTFWIESLLPLLKTVERELSQWCLLELGWSGAVLKETVDSSAWRGEAEEMTPEAIDGKVPDAVYRRLWGDWVGREAEFYMECARLVDPLSWDEVVSITGPDVRARAKLTVDAYRALCSDRIPATLRPGSLRIIKLDVATTRVATYSTYDPVDIPNVVVDVIRSFDGRPTSDVQEGIQREYGVTIEDSLIRKLYDFDLLVEYGGS